MPSMTLKERRVRFTILTANLIQRIATKDRWQCWAHLQYSRPKVEVAMDEWTVHNPRMVKVGTERVLAQDRVHNPNGLHPHGLACDLLIYIDGEYLTNGAHPIWAEIDSIARSMDPEFGLGIAFNDANHLSYGE